MKSHHPKNIDSWRYKHRHEKYCILYTDGSYKAKMKTISTGIAGINYKNEQIQLSQKVKVAHDVKNMPQSTYAELWAIKMAIKHAIKKDYSSILIASDVQPLHNLLRKKHTAKTPEQIAYTNIITYIKQAADEHNIDFLYTPSHKNIYYNELAHILAHKMAQTEKPLISKIDIYPEINKKSITINTIIYNKNGSIDTKHKKIYQINNKQSGDFTKLAYTLIWNQLRDLNIKNVTIFMKKPKTMYSTKTTIDVHPDIKVKYIS